MLEEDWRCLSPRNGKVRYVRIPAINPVTIISSSNMAAIAFEDATTCGSLFTSFVCFFVERFPRESRNFCTTVDYKSVLLQSKFLFGAYIIDRA